MSLNLTSRVKRFGRAIGVDLMGFAPIGLFCNAERYGGINPAIYLSDATGVLVMACRIQQGTSRVAGPYNTPGKTYGPYLYYGYGYLNFFLAECAYRVANYLESNGYSAIPFPPTGPASMYRRYEGFAEMPTSEPFSADISHRHAAVAAGLGVIGFSGLLLTPQFGAKQRIVSIVTNAPLETDGQYVGPSLCEAEKCLICVKRCPTHALRGDRCNEFTVGDRTFRYASVDYTRCLLSIAGFIRKAGARTDLKIPLDSVKLGRDYYWKNRDKRSSIDFSMITEPIHMNLCGLCLISCPSTLKYRKR